MSDLISRKALLENLMEEIPLAENVHIFKDIIENQPIAFDKEKVIKELKEIMEFHSKRQTEGGYFAMRAYAKAIEIVEKGGIE